jgi:hypothetical protein
VRKTVAQLDNPSRSVRRGIGHAKVVHELSEMIEIIVQGIDFEGMHVCLRVVVYDNVDRGLHFRQVVMLW